MKRPKIQRHQCRLDEVAVIRELPKIPPFAKNYERLDDIFTRWTTATMWNPLSRGYFRSTCHIYKERRRQLLDNNYHHIIHPFSKLAIVREMTITILWLLVFILDPICFAYGAPIVTHSPDLGLRYLLAFVNFLLLVDIVVQTFLGYTIGANKEIVLHQQKILKHYATTYLFIDLIPNIYSYVCLFSGGRNARLFVPQLYAIRLLRAGSLRRYFINFLLFFHIEESYIKTITICVACMLLIHWFATLFYIVPVLCHFCGYQLTESYIHKHAIAVKRHRVAIYVDCLEIITAHFFGAGQASVGTKEPVEQLILTVILLCGLSCHIYVIAVIMQLFGTINIAESKYEELIHQLKQYMITKKLSQNFRKRLLMYYEYRYKKQFFAENLIINSLSEHLRYEILLYSCRTLIGNLRVFQGMPKSILGSLVSLLKPEIFLPGDEIVNFKSQDHRSSDIYFISFGTVSLYSIDGYEVMHLEDGNHFGAMAPLLDSSKVLYYGKVRVVAAEITQIYYLKRYDFMKILNANPEISDIWKKRAILQMATYEERLNDAIVRRKPKKDKLQEITEELRRGNILNINRRRV